MLYVFWIGRAHHLPLVAMSCRHHPLVIDEGASTEVVARVQRHLVGDRILLAGISSNDLIIVIDRESNLSKKEERRQFIKLLEIAVLSPVSTLS